MSIKVWNSLNPDEQAIVQKAGLDATSVGWQEAKKIEDEYRGRVGEFGMELVELTDQQKIDTIKAIREKVWPQLDKSIGNPIMDQVRAIAQPLP